ncbi:MAG TPA: hypothetical protein VF582_06175 [Allosphingosinicella sp.]
MTPKSIFLLMRNVRQVFADLMANATGLGTIEFAATAPFLAVLIVGVADGSAGLATKFNLQQAVNRGLERAATSDLRHDYSDVQAEGAEAADVPIENVGLDFWLECDGEEMPEITDVCEDGAEIARFIRLRITSSYDPMFEYGPIGQFTGLSPDGTFPLVAEGTLRLQ